MKKLLTILLIFSILYSTFGVYFTFGIIQYSHKLKVIKRFIQKKFGKIEYITLPKILVDNKTTHFKRVNHHEFLFKSKMYDIIQETIRKDSVCFKCVFDKTESEWIKKFNKTTDKDKKSIIIKIKTLIFDTIVKQIFIYRKNIDLTTFINYFASYYKSFKIDVNSPPPRY